MNIDKIDKIEDKAPEYPHYDGLQEKYESTHGKADMRRQAYQNDHCEKEYDATPDL